MEDLLKENDQKKKLFYLGMGRSIMDKFMDTIITENPY